MRLVTYDSEGDWRAGILIEDKVVDSLAAFQAANIAGGAAVTRITNRTILQMPPNQQSQIEQAARDLKTASTSNRVHSVENLHLGYRTRIKLFALDLTIAATQKRRILNRPNFQCYLQNFAMH